MIRVKNKTCRMDYTGERGFIHIPEKTAMALQELDPKVKCRYELLKIYI